MSLPRSRSLLRVGVCHSVVHFHDVLGGTRRSTLSAQRYIGCSSGSCQLLSGISISGSLARTLSIMMPSSEKAPRPASIAASNSFLIRSALCCTWGLCIFVCRCEPRIRRRARALAFAVPWRKGRVDERHLSWMDGLLAREAHVGTLTRLHGQRVCSKAHSRERKIDRQQGDTCCCLRTGILEVDVHHVDGLQVVRARIHDEATAGVQQLSCVWRTSHARIGAVVLRRKLSHGVVWR